MTGSSDPDPANGPAPVVLVDHMTIDYDVLGVEVTAKGLLLRCSKPVYRYGDCESDPFDKLIKWREIDAARAAFGERLAAWTREHVFKTEAVKTEAEA